MQTWSVVWESVAEVIGIHPVAPQTLVRSHDGHLLLLDAKSGAVLAKLAKKFAGARFSNDGRFALTWPDVTLQWWPLLDIEDVAARVLAGASVH